jgi:putative DNA primase/helicase
MSSDQNIVDFPKAEVDPAELIRRQRVEAERLARLSPGEWQLWIEDSAAQLGIPVATLAASVKAIIAEREKAEREANAETRREQARAEKVAARKKRQKEREFKILRELPADEQARRLDDMATRLEEDPAAVRDEFAECAPTRTDTEGVEPWPEPVEGGKLLDDLNKQIGRYIVVNDHAATAVALWVMMAWTHNAIATHSPNLVVTSAEPDSGKTTMLGVLERLTPKPLVATELTGPGLFRAVDQKQPTLIIDESDSLFQRRLDLLHIVNAGWISGTRVPRVVQGVTHYFDPFCPKVIGMKGLALPPTLAGRSIIIKLWPRLPDEKVEDFSFQDDPEFKELRQRLARFSADTLMALADAKPKMPAGFRNRLACNWKLLLAIADHAGDEWPERAREAATRVSQRASEPSAGIRLLEALSVIFANREEIPSAEIVKELTADPADEWCEYKGRTPITQRQIAHLLRPFEIYPKTIHPTQEASLSPRGYTRAHFVDAFARFVDPHIRTGPAKTPRKRPAR